MTDTIGRRIRWIVEIHVAVSHAEFAKRLGVSRQLLSRWVNDPTQPPSKVSIRRIAQAGGVSLAWLHYGHGSPLEAWDLPEMDPTVLYSTLRQIERVIQAAIGPGRSAGGR